MTSLIEPAQTEGAAPLAEALDEVRRSAQSLLADLAHRPRALRIRAGDVVVEMEWTEQQQAPAATPAPAPAPEAPDTPPAPPPGVGISSPIVGTFYRAAEPGGTPFVSEGDQVRRGQQVGIVEAMKLMIPVEADADGRILAVHTADGAPVEFGERLMTIDPQAG
ncbi:acetyl-CoA carboxylase biotin carboxyl carrier protein [Asanoa iriomotensis]|uniref:Biotin carboxyl carrier protein of acetyl-CoA carboxylase n=1 Tax=Asanoa iriomotensis TaxID=234613 RepID=A0ABQ4BYM2_9ACTN|nr:acetyl-CoA carboxylase biotin carboxyl carrier protein subunit [Asanoa iriomotensis]GIF55271.1 hypothetical protein Air01nite_13660 [Asanoa iriomotensis]